MTRLTDNFFAGDCDGDGAPNGCDDEICMPGGGTSTCTSVPGVGCTPSYTPPPDAGVDAGPDSGSDAGDAGGESETDGGSNVTPTDGGSGGIDGGAGGHVPSFGGGGGCRCAVGSRQAPLGSILFGLALGIVIAQRRRSR
jgi:hypothetical protein